MLKFANQTSDEIPILFLKPSKRLLYKEKFKALNLLQKTCSMQWMLRISNPKYTSNKGTETQSYQANKNTKELNHISIGYRVETTY